MTSGQWLILIVAVVLLLIVVWWWWSRRPATTPMPMTPPEVRMPPAATRPPDDLAILEGVGPKIVTVLNGAGITTFAQLATTDANTLKSILKAAGLQFTDPTTWAEQAALAAAGKSAELAALQDSLKGGRRA